MKQGPVQSSSDRLVEQVCGRHNIKFCKAKNKSRPRLPRTRIACQAAEPNAVHALPPILHRRSVHVPRHPHGLTNIYMRLSITFSLPTLSHDTFITGVITMHLFAYVLVSLCEYELRSLRMMNGKRVLSILTSKALVTCIHHFTCINT